jgi:hypothetical protein
MEQYELVGKAAATATTGLQAVLDALDAATTPPARTRRR